jgi:hypothetical protein
MADVNPTLPSVGDNNSVADPEIRTALSDLVTAANTIETEQFADGAVTAAKFAPVAWQTLTLGGGATWSAPLRYRKDALGVVRFRADVFQITANITTGTTIGTMPSGYRPSAKVYLEWRNFATAVGSSVGPTFFDALVSVDTDGTMQPVHASLLSETDTVHRGNSPINVAYRAA